MFGSLVIFKHRLQPVRLMGIALAHSDRSLCVFSGYLDSYYVHDFELHTANGFTAWIVGQVCALTFSNFISLLTLNLCVHNPVTVIWLHMRLHFQHVRVDKLLVLF